MLRPKHIFSNHLEGLNQRFVHAGLPIVATDVQTGIYRYSDVAKVAALGLPRGLCHPGKRARLRGRTVRSGCQCPAEHKSNIAISILRVSMIEKTFFSIEERDEDDGEM
jgi:hypothetical protein